MRALRFLLLPAAALAALFLAGCGGGSKQKPLEGDAVAAVGTVTIPKADLDTLLAEAKRRDKAHGKTFPKPGTAEYKKVRDDSLHYLVQESEYEQKLEELGGEPVTPQEVELRLAQVKAQLFGEQQGNYEPELESAGLTEADLKAQLHDDLVEEHLFAKVNEDTTVTQEELQAAYDKNVSLYTKPSTREVRHIYVTSEKLAKELESKLHDGADFAALAKKYSQDPASAPVGGKLLVTQGSSIPEFETVAFELKTNEISDPVDTGNGWHIIQAISPTKTGLRTPLAAVAPTLRKSLLGTKKQNVWKKFVAETKKEFSDSVRYR